MQEITEMQSNTSANVQTDSKEQIRADALDNLRRNTDWWSVYAAFGLTNIEISPENISKILNLDTSTVNEALEGLIDAGMLRKDINGSYQHADFNFFKDEEGIEDKIIKHSQASHQILNDLTTDRKMAYQAHSFATNRELFIELARDIQNAITKCRMASEAAENNDMVLKMTSTLVNVAKIGESNA